MMVEKSTTYAVMNCRVNKHTHRRVDNGVLLTANILSPIRPSDGGESEESQKKIDFRKRIKSISVHRLFIQQSVAGEQRRRRRRRTILPFLDELCCRLRPTRNTPRVWLSFDLPAIGCTRQTNEKTHSHSQRVWTFLCGVQNLILKDFLSLLPPLLGQNHYKQNQNKQIMVARATGKEKRRMRTRTEAFDYSC